MIFYTILYYTICFLPSTIFYTFLSYISFLFSSKFSSKATNLINMKRFHNHCEEWMYLYENETDPLASYRITINIGWARGCSVSIVSNYGLGFDPQQGQRIFILASASRLALGPTQPPIQMVLEVLSPVINCGWGVMLTTHPHLVPR
jgi:hypothetical protein